MPSNPIDPSQLSADAIARAKAAANATGDTITNVTTDIRLAREHAAAAIKDILKSGGIFKTVVDAGFSLASSILAGFFSLISAFRHEAAETFDDTTAEVLNEFLGTEFTGSQIAAGSGTDVMLTKAGTVGNLVLNRLEQEFTGGGPVTMESGAKGARTFAGYGVNFAVQNALVSLLGACIPETRLDDIRELGVEVAGNLGLGRLMNRALRPLVENTITKPYNRQLQRKYQMDLLSAAELATAVLADRMEGDTAMELLKQHGFSDDQITELLEQKTPRLHTEEWALLDAMKVTPLEVGLMHDKAVGTPQNIIDLRLQVLTHKRLQHHKDRILNAVLSQINEGFLPAAALDPWLTRLNVPDDEQDLWRLAAGVEAERTRKRISHAEMLFLFEASQVTQEDVRLWAISEGYSSDDIERLLVFFELKATEAAQKTTGGAAAAAGHLHKEHVAFMTDLITGWWGRSPTTAELDYWVTMLDTKERTKADVKNELKTLDTSGPAMP
ncbi:MAG: hypothetical protein LAN64_16650 [Acidobacteriia bacterium]|nr:hypothetical protein [Terriglobia bacterium]